MNARLELKEWLAATGTSQERLAELADCHRVTVSRVLGGHNDPSLELATAIERITGGRVLASSWLVPKGHAEPGLQPVRPGDERS